jgi:hypothetical protein
MQLQAQLTAGWEDDPQHALAALRLHTTADPAAADYPARLGNVLAAAVEPVQIYGLEQLFRKRPGGFNTLRQFIGTLVTLPAPAAQPLLCRIDGFAYAFLVAAKNFDFVVPLNKLLSVEFYRRRLAWLDTMYGLADFERFGEPLPVAASVSADHYLALRAIISRPSARDEIRALATLLLSGPSTMADISQDLGLNYSLGQRTLAAFEAIDVVERRAADLFAISAAALPLVLFGLRETIGLDPLPVLAMGDDRNG